MNNRNGFTVVELLIVLLLISIISILVIPNVYHIIVRKQTEHFFHTFDSDVLLVQTQSLGTVKNNRLNLYLDEYIVFENDRVLLKRTFPKQIEFTNVPHARIQFYNNGTIVQPTTYIVKDQTDTYRIVFPFGKGRHYVDKR